MAKFKLMANAEIETATPGDVGKELRKFGAEQTARLLADAQGKKYARLNPPIAGTAVAGVLSIGGDAPAPGGTDQPVGPRAGYAWAMRRIAVTGLTAGATPDVVNLFRRSEQVWQFNGDNWAYTFSFAEMIYLEGEYLSLKSVGAFAATGTITLRADFVEVPQPMLFKALG